MLRLATLFYRDPSQGFAVTSGCQFRPIITNLVFKFLLPRFDVVNSLKKNLRSSEIAPASLLASSTLFVYAIDIFNLLSCSINVPTLVSHKLNYNRS